MKPDLAQGAHRRQVREPVRAKPLHTSAFMIHTDQQIGADPFDVGAQGTQLGAVFPVAREQDDAAGEGVCEPEPIHRGQPGAGDVENDGGYVGHGGSGIWRF